MTKIVSKNQDKEFDMSKVDYTDFTLDTTSLGVSMGAGSVLLPSIKYGTNSIVHSILARQKYDKQISTANTLNKINKLSGRKKVHEDYLKTIFTIELGTEAIPSMLSTTKDKVKNLNKENTNAE